MSTCTYIFIHFLTTINIYKPVGVGGGGTFNSPRLAALNICRYSIDGARSNINSNLRTDNIMRVVEFYVRS